MYYVQVTSHYKPNFIRGLLVLRNYGRLCVLAQVLLMVGVIFREQYH